jgi:DNA-binding NarL/FixJ family response regulator
MAQNPCTVVVADQHSLVRIGARALLAKVKIAVVGEAQDGREAIALVKKHAPTVVTLNHPMPHLHGIAAAHQIISSGGNTRVLLLTDHGDDYTIEQAWRLQVHGFMLKSSPCELLAEAVQTIASGGTWYDKPVKEHIARYAHMPGYARRDPCPLSARELEVFLLLVEGKTNRAIAGDLNMSEKTVEKHRQNLMDKLNIHNIAGLVHYAISTGVVEAAAA